MTSSHRRSTRASRIALNAGTEGAIEENIEVGPFRR
jgi:hypothetical protein